MQQAPINLHNAHLRTEAGYLQCDPHRRRANDERERQMEEAHQRLIMRFAPFIWPDDERIQDPVKLMETVAERLWTGAQNEKDRRTRLIENESWPL
jgi:hypothetical protein